MRSIINLKEATSPSLIIYQFNLLFQPFIIPGFQFQFKILQLPLTFHQIKPTKFEPINIQS
jgi:hypothetical protein